MEWFKLRPTHLGVILIGNSPIVSLPKSAGLENARQCNRKYQMICPSVSRWRAKHARTRSKRSESLEILSTAGLQHFEAKLG